MAAFLVLAAATAAPAAAQFGGLKKKAQSAAGVASETKDKQPAPGRAAETGGAVVLNDEVIDRFLAGVRAGQAEREAATKEDTPYGRHLKAEAAYAAAKSKCDEATATWPQRAVADEKLRDRYTAMADKMMAAMEKRDMKLYQVYGDSATAMLDPACVVKQPQRPDNWYDLEREVNNRAEQAERKTSGLDPRELGVIRERAGAILQGTPLPDTSPSEKSAVNKRAAELKRAMGLEQAPPARATKPAPAPAAPPPAPAGPQMSADQAAMADCMSKNSQKHEKEIERMGERARAAEESGNTQAAIAIADSIRQLVMARCSGS